MSENNYSIFESTFEPPEYYKKHPEILESWNKGITNIFDDIEENLSKYIYDPEIRSPDNDNYYKWMLEDFNLFDLNLKDKESNLGEEIVNYAKQFLGDKYVYNGSNPKTGFDCSGLIQYTYKQFGINIPRSSVDMRKIGRHVELQDVQPGDIICMKSKQSPSDSHVKMISKIDNNGTIWTIEARGKDYGIVERPFISMLNVVDIRRVLESTSKVSNSGKFTSNEQFTKTMINAYSKELRNRGIDTSFAYLLTALDANESGWGKKIIGDYNYGNITSKSGTYSNKVNRTFKNYNSLEDYIKAKIDLLSNSRYKFFETFNSINNPSLMMQTLADRGYDPGNSSYGKNIALTLNTVMKYAT